jgi:Domain of unknown function (DU1801)
MPLETIKDLKGFLTPYPKKGTDLIWELRKFVWELYPSSNELIYDNYNAVALGWSLSDKLSTTFCTIAAFANYIHFGFYYGNKIADPEKKLTGKGNQYRYIKLENGSDFPKPISKKLLKEAPANAMTGLKDGKQVLKGATIVKPVSAKKKRPK